MLDPLRRPDQSEEEFERLKRLAIRLMKEYKDAGYPTARRARGCGCGLSTGGR